MNIITGPDTLISIAEVKDLIRLNFLAWGVKKKCQPCENYAICRQPDKPGYEDWCEKSPDWAEQERKMNG
jgi:hypothetical protein